MRVGLVLGAGGIIGSAWHAGGLKALEEETGWDPCDADVIVGTSAGSVLGALVAAGEPPWRPGSASAPPPARPAGDGGRSADADRSRGAGFSLDGLPRLGPASARLALSALRRMDARTPSGVAAGLLPEGRVSTAPVEQLVRRVVPTGWVDHPNLWVVACDYATGERIAFGREGAPEADLADAVAASCAIPSFYRPKTIGGRKYVDGGLWSTSNLDLLAGVGLDLVVCLNPTSSRDAASAAWPAARLAARMRGVSGRRLGNEAKDLAAAGTDLVLVQPTAEDLAVMPSNLMSRRRRREVYETAQRTMVAQLRAPAHRELVSRLPGRSRARRTAEPV